MMVKTKNGRSRKISDSRSDKIFYAVNGILLTVFMLLTLYPVLCMISSAISSPRALYTGRVSFYPVGFSLKGFEMVLQNQNIVHSFFNSVFYTVGGTVLSLITTILTAYALSRKELIGRGFLNMMFAVTMWFSGGIVPFYLLCRDIGIINTPWVMFLPGLMSVYNMIVCRTYFQNSIPEELYEAVTIDGCGYFRFLWYIVLPLSGAIIAVLALWYTIGKWNAYFNALIMIYDKSLYPLQLVLRGILVTGSSTVELIGDEDVNLMGAEDLMKNALILLSCMPLWLIYPFVQKYFTKGIMLGSVKA